MKKTMEWSDPVIIKLSENRGASGAGSCDNGNFYGNDPCNNGGAAVSSCSNGTVVGASGVYCEAGGAAAN